MDRTKITKMTAVAAGMMALSIIPSVAMADGGQQNDRNDGRNAPIARDNRPNVRFDQDRHFDNRDNQQIRFFDSRTGFAYGHYDNRDGRDCGR